MPILYDYYVNPTPKGAAEKDSMCYHARVVGGHTMGIETLTQHISQRCTLTKADIAAVIIEFIHELVNVLCEGNRLAIPGLGYFSLTLSATTCKEGPSCHSHSQGIKIKHVQFRADQTLKDELSTRAKFERTSMKRHSKTLAPNVMEELLTNYFELNQYLRRCDLEKLCQFTPSMAKRKLKELVETKRLVNINTSHYPLYVPVDYTGSAETTNCTTKG